MSLIELAERCEKSTGPDREIDGIIDRLFHKRPKNGDYDETENAIWRVKEGEASGLLVRGDGFARGSFCAASYTASIDAAMSLVPKGCLWHVTNTSVEQHFADLSRSTALVGYPDDTCDNTVEAATPALALVAAALRARAQQEQTI